MKEMCLVLARAELLHTKVGKLKLLSNCLRQKKITQFIFVKRAAHLHTHV